MLYVVFPLLSSVKQAITNVSQNATCRLHEKAFRFCVFKNISYMAHNVMRTWCTYKLALSYNQHNTLATKSCHFHGLCFVLCIQMICLALYWTVTDADNLLSAWYFKHHLPYCSLSKTNRFSILKLNVTFGMLVYFCFFAAWSKHSLTNKLYVLIKCYIVNALSTIQLDKPWRSA